MTLIIEKKVEEPLLDRMRIVATSAEKTVSTDAVRKDLATQLSKGEELVTIEHIYPSFGWGKSRILACAYTKPQTKEFFKKKVKKTATPAASGGT